MKDRILNMIKEYSKVNNVPNYTSFDKWYRSYILICVRKCKEVDDMLIKEVERQLIKDNGGTNENII